MNAKKLPKIVLYLTLLIISAHSFSGVKIGVFIGNDHGFPNERPLKYASQDAVRMARLLQQFGGIENDRTYLLINRRIDQVFDALGEVSGRVKELHRVGIETMLIFYYSGHGSSGSLHIFNKKIQRENLTEIIDSIQSDMKILIIDACESGDFLRQKGGKIVHNHQVKKNDNIRSKGSISISSSAKGELSHESEDYNGSVFTHHFMNGLRGLADYNKDNRIGIMEACNYASVSTKMDNSSGSKLSQHPLFDFDIVGQSDIIISNLNSGSSKVVFKNISSQYIEIHDAYNMNLTARVYLGERDSVQYHLQSNKYICSFADEKCFYSKVIDLTWGKNAVIEKNSFVRNPNLTLYSKGISNKSTGYHGVQMSSRMASPAFDETVWFGQLAWVFRRYYTKQELCFGYGSVMATGNGVMLSNYLQFYKFSYALKYPFLRFVYGQFVIGGEAALLKVTQSINDLRMKDGPLYYNQIELPSRLKYNANMFQISVPFEVEFYLPLSIWASFSLNNSIYVYKNYALEKADGKWAFEPGFAIGHQF